MVEVAKSTASRTTVENPIETVPPQSSNPPAVILIPRGAWPDGPTSIGEIEAGALRNSACLS